MKVLSLKPCVNKKNGQISISLPKKKFSSEMKRNILAGEKIKLKIDWD